MERTPRGEELAASLKETQKRALLVQQARAGIPSDNGEYAARVTAVRARMNRCTIAWRRADDQNRFLQSLAVEELERQKQRIETYQVQARFDLAAIYDKAANEKPKANP